MIEKHRRHKMTNKRGAKIKHKDLIKDRTIAFKVTPAEYRLLFETANKEGLTLSGSVRRASIAYARRSDLLYPDAGE